MAQKTIKPKDIEEQEEDILDILLNEDNDDPVTLYDENEKAVKFEQVAVIPENENIYAILKPLDEMEGVSDDEAIVFLVDFDEEGHSLLTIEQNEETAIKVFDKYYTLLDEEEAKQTTEIKKPKK
ncbi:MAG: hypothetical protein PHS54_05625 [Clostridia bacterium]|nr:hypothetical protein [Clostridia bacterium]